PSRPHGSASVGTNLFSEPVAACVIAIAAVLPNPPVAVVILLQRVAAVAFWTASALHCPLLPFPRPRLAALTIAQGCHRLIPRRCGWCPTRGQLVRPRRRPAIGASGQN